jgi:hypothetical protein
VTVCVCVVGNTAGGIPWSRVCGAQPAATQHDIDVLQRRIRAQESLQWDDPSALVTALPYVRLRS